MLDNRLSCQLMAKKTPQNMKVNHSARGQQFLEHNVKQAYSTVYLDYTQSNIIVCGVFLERSKRSCCESLSTFGNIRFHFISVLAKLYIMLQRLKSPHESFKTISYSSAGPTVGERLSNATACPEILHHFTMYCSIQE